MQVNWARKNGWIVMYIPSAYLLVEGSSYVKGEDELWETPDAARFILNSMKDNHLNSLEVMSNQHYMICSACKCCDIAPSNLFQP